MQVVDSVLEDIRLGMELNWPKLGQRRISTVKYLGELYIYQLVESNVVFHTLYSFLSFGWNPDGTATELDPPHSYFRVRLVCALLDSCGQYFDHGTNKKRLDNFLVFFQVRASIPATRMDCSKERHALYTGCAIPTLSIQTVRIGNSTCYLSIHPLPHIRSTPCPTPCPTPALPLPHPSV